jgi:hypothetical protein
MQLAPDDAYLSCEYIMHYRVVGIDGEGWSRELDGSNGCGIICAN